MNRPAVNCENDYLIIYKDMNGNFYSYNWFSHEKGSRDKLIESLDVWNNEREKNRDVRIAGEIVDDPLIRAICAYQYRQTLENLTDDIKLELRVSIGDVRKLLEKAIDDIQDVVTEIYRMEEKL